MGALQHGPSFFFQKNKIFRYNLTNQTTNTIEISLEEPIERISTSKVTCNSEQTKCAVDYTTYKKEGRLLIPVDEITEILEFN